MNRRLLASYCVLAAVIAAVSLPPLPAFGQSSAASGEKPALPRTPWGDPDLRGMWVNNSATPLERPQEFAGKQTLTEEELAELKEKAAEVLDGGDAFFGDDFVKAAVAELSASSPSRTAGFRLFVRRFDLNICAGDSDLLDIAMSGSSFRRLLRMDKAPAPRKSVDSSLAKTPAVVAEKAQSNCRCHLKSKA